MIFRVWISSVYRKKLNTKLVKMTSHMGICRCRHFRFVTERREGGASRAYLFVLEQKPSIFSNIAVTTVIIQRRRKNGRSFMLVGTD